MFQKTRLLLKALLLLLGAAYPLFVLAALTFLPAFAVGLLLIAVLAVRLLFVSGKTKALISPGMLLACIATSGGLLFLDATLAIQAYPVVISFGLAVMFARSLMSPPNIIEKFARLAEPRLNAQGVRYTQKVALIWILFFVANAAIAAVLAVRGDMSSWAFYTGFLSYGLIGLLLGGEFIVRQFVKHRHRGET